MKTQDQVYPGDYVTKKIGEKDRHVMELLNHPTNPLTPAELLHLATTKPERWGRYLGLAQNLLLKIQKEVEKHYEGGQ